MAQGWTVETLILQAKKMGLFFWAMRKSLSDSDAGE